MIVTSFKSILMSLCVIKLVSTVATDSKRGWLAITQFLRPSEKSLYAERQGSYLRDDSSTFLHAALPYANLCSQHPVATDSLCKRATSALNFAQDTVLYQNSVRLQVANQALRLVWN